MGKKLSTHWSDNSTDYCEIHFSYKEEYAYIKYFTEEGIKYFEETFPNNSLRYVEDAAENWALGYKDLSPEHHTQYTLKFPKTA
jgi:hypothetical protein|tara:strand:+ start:292 stop:543 length:252 start_codon:yes stop_codon:yes gene_type:complete